jgi:hypothetical protein
MNVKIEITLTNDEYTEEAKEIQVQIEEHMPDGFQNIDKSSICRSCKDGDA